jgi:hypothetical protein
MEAAKESDLICCAWGEHGRILWQASGLIKRLVSEFDCYCIGLTKGGKPLHPSRAAYTDVPVRFKAYALREQPALSSSSNPPAAKDPGEAKTKG